MEYQHLQGGSLISVAYAVLGELLVVPIWCNRHLVAQNYMTIDRAFLQSRDGARGVLPGRRVYYNAPVRLAALGYDFKYQVDSKTSSIIFIMECYN